MTGESREVSKNPLARAPEVGGNMLRGLLETAINGTATPIDTWPTPDRS
mgnify:CR=1 FL=1